MLMDVDATSKLGAIWHHISVAAPGPLVQRLCSTCVLRLLQVELNIIGIQFGSVEDFEDGIFIE